MKTLKWFVVAILILALVGLLFRGWFYRNLVTYKSTGLRSDYLATDARLVTLINARADSHANALK